MVVRSSANIYLACEQALQGALAAEQEYRKESSQLRLWNLNICIEKVDVNCWLAEMTLLMTSLPLACFFQCLFTFAVVSTLHWLAEIWKLGQWPGSHRGIGGEIQIPET